MHVADGARAAWGLCRSRSSLLLSAQLSVMTLVTDEDSGGASWRARLRVAEALAGPYCWWAGAACAMDDPIIGPG